MLQQIELPAAPTTGLENPKKHRTLAPLKKTKNIHNPVTRPFNIFIISSFWDSKGFAVSFLQYFHPFGIILKNVEDVKRL